MVRVQRRLAVILAIIAAIAACAPRDFRPLAEQPTEVYVAFRPLPGTRLVYTKTTSVVISPDADSPGPINNRAREEYTIEVLRADQEGYLTRLTAQGTSLSATVGHDGMVKSLKIDGVPDTAAERFAGWWRSWTESLTVHLRPWKLGESRPLTMSLSDPAAPDSSVTATGQLTFQRVVALGRFQAAEFGATLTATASGSLTMRIISRSYIEVSTGALLRSSGVAEGNGQLDDMRFKFRVEETQALDAERSRGPL